MIGGSVGSDLYMFNDGDATVTVTSTSLVGPKFRLEKFTGTNGAFTIAAQSGTAVEVAGGASGPAKLRVWFEPVSGDKGTLLTDTLSVVHDGGGASTIALSGWAVETGSSRISLSPSSWTFNWIGGQDFTGGIIIDQESNELHLQLVSSGDLPLTIYGVNVLFPLKLVPPIPLLPVVLLPGTSVLLPLVLVSAVAGASGSLTDLLEIDSDSPSSPDYYVVSYTGIALTSANTITGAGYKGLLSFGGAIQYANPSDLTCEEASSLVQTTNLGEPFVDKAFVQLRLKYEDLGVATITAAVVSETSDSSSCSIGTAGADNSIKAALITFHVEGEYVKLTLGTAAGVGPASITELAYGIDELNEFSVLAGLAAVVSAYSVTGGSLGLLAFGTSILKADPSNLACEEAASLTQTTNFAEPFVEKTPIQLRLKYEDRGASLISVSVTSGGVTSVSPNVVIGTVGADNYVKDAILPFHVEGEFAEAVIYVGANAGPVSITELDYGIDEWSEFTVLGGLPAVVSAFSVTGTPLGLFAFGTGILKADPSNLDCEEAASFVKTHDFQLSGFEKHVPYVTLKYEDLGVAAFSLSAKSKRETIAGSPATVSIGTVGADRLIKWAQTNISINEEIVEFTLSRTALSGPLSFTEQMFRHEQRGEVREGT